MRVTRKYENYTVSNRESGLILSPELWVHIHLFSIENAELQLVLTASDHQTVLPPVSSLIPAREEPNEGGVLSGNRPVAVGAVVVVEKEEDR